MLSQHAAATSSTRPVCCSKAEWSVQGLLWQDVNTFCSSKASHACAAAITIMLSHVLNILLIRRGENKRVRIALSTIAWILMLPLLVNTRFEHACFI